MKNGIAAIEIKEGLICTHNFIAEIGIGFMQRSSYTIDFTIPNEKSTLNKRTKLSTLIPRLNFSKIIIKKANKIIHYFQFRFSNNKSTESYYKLK